MDSLLLQNGGKEEDIAPKLQTFMALMEERLVANEHKGGWRYDNTTNLMRRLEEEAAELRKVLDDGGLWTRRRNEAAREAADVANFAMMICDVLGMLGE